jgi:hypothetical protein
MRRHSILGLMGLTLIAAIAIAALKGADDNWASVLQFLTLGMNGVAVLGVVHAKGKARAGWLGFALFGGFYHLLAAGPWIGEQARPNLPTTLLINYAYQRIVPGQSWTFAIQAMNTTGTAPIQTGVNWLVSNATPSPNSQQVFVVSSTAGWSTGWPSILTSNANAEAFQRVAHSLFALLFGLIGMFISRRMKKVEPEEAPSVA